MPGNFSFFINGYGKVYDSNLLSFKIILLIGSGHLIFCPSAAKTMNTLAQRENNDWHALYKLVWDISSVKKLPALHDLSMNINQGYYMPRAFSSTYFVCLHEYFR